MGTIHTTDLEGLVRLREQRDRAVSAEDGVRKWTNNQSYEIALRVGLEQGTRAERDLLRDLLAGVLRLQAARLTEELKRAGVVDPPTESRAESWG